MAPEDSLRPTTPTEGSLADVPLGDVLASLADGAGHGILHLSGSYSSIVCLRDGGIYLAHAETGPSLRQVFLVAGIVDEAQWDQAVEDTRRGGTLIEALLRVGGAPPEQVRAALYEHTLNTLFELLVPSSNQFRFGTGEVHQLGAHFVFPVDEVLRAATARLTEFAEIARSLPTTDVVVRVAPWLPPGTAEVTLSAIEWQVLAGVDGKSTVADIIADVGHSAFTVFSALHRLLRAGAIETVGRD